MECSICVHTSKTKKIIDYNGKKICIDCLTMLKYPPNFEKMKEEVENILYNLKKENKKYHCILAFSGGKDSVLSLKLLVEKFKLNPLCVMVDNKYIANEAIENALNVTKHYNVDLIILNRDFTDLFEDVIKRGESPCRRCSRLILREVWRFAKLLNIKYIVTGHELPFGHSAIRDMKEGIKMIRLLTPYKFKEEEKYKMLKDLPWKKPNLGGYTTNCLVLGLALNRFFEKYGFSFEIDRIATLVRLGLLSKEKGKKLLEKPEVPEEVYEELKKRGLKI
ncbi:phosphoadenosine phosphosulfate reductase domain-containing protein [Methanocaldococcus sp.]|uniref:phosphoadenosine phosphosulfate reductase domain-containing protein n=1 Tax=Methanocaldococcus sp. TaxID=2152917 RepID=UPI00260F1DE9|nr:phosphoadenosine phosphosulfate reductase family protein [Methanocaldococcus sp.]MCQ6253864.1 phosphoadenosine phosphosulfate reductase family protein [Methanocaldococcus sp.]